MQVPSMIRSFSLPSPRQIRSKNLSMNKQNALSTLRILSCYH